MGDDGTGIPGATGRKRGTGIMSQSSPALVRPSAAPVEIRALDKPDVEAWNAYVEAHPQGTFFHLAGWREVSLWNAK